jgi:alpha-L-fucosidase
LVVEGVAAWMDINKESIFDTRPWKMYGEVPVAETTNPINAQGFNEGKNKV